MKFQIPRGVSDVLPEESFLWQFIQEQARAVFSNYNFRQIIIPVIEDAKLFNRSLGSASEVVEKQMFLIQRSDDTLALRPEGTAGVVRAYLENNLDRKSPYLKLYYFGPMFRAERPQKGRLRQFNHVGAEALGSNSPFVDVEIIALCSDILNAIGVSGYKIRINTLGSAEDKKKFAAILRNTLKPKLKSFCKDCQQRFERNVFRLLDCKNEDCRKIIAGMNLNPQEYLSKESLDNFEKVKNGLDLLKIKYVYDKFLVRGLDYYTSTVFEISHPSLGAQDAIGAGGRYDNLVKELGGNETGAIGFALGLERLVLAVDKENKTAEPKVTLYIAALGDAAVEKALVLAKDLRKENVSAEIDFHDRRLDKKISQASKIGAKFLGIIGENELNKNIITIKNLSTGQQQELAMEVKVLKEKLC